ncbi:hypothetical protein BGC33_00255, partial [Bathymodiolus thermophilus thioautotrophic gill symbiont]
KKTTKTSGFQNLYFSKKIKKSAKKNPIFLSEKTPILIFAFFVKKRHDNPQGTVYNHSFSTKKRC